MRKNKLKLNKKTIRILTEGELERAVGGISSPRGCTSIDLSCPRTADCPISGGDVCVSGGPFPLCG
jgi:hypothetical protein